MDDAERVQEGVEDYQLNTKIFDMKSIKENGGGKDAIPVEKRITTRFMTKYERARLLGTRALQLRYNIFPSYFWNF